MHIPYVACYVQGNFGGAWEELGEENELGDTFSLPMKTLEEAVKNIVLFLGLQVGQWVNVFFYYYGISFN